MNAALSIRTDNFSKGDVRSLFHRHSGEYARTLSLEAEMIVPKSGTDDLGQTAEASITFLRYKLELAYAGEQSVLPGPLEILREELTHINLGRACQFAICGPKQRVAQVGDQRPADVSVYLYGRRWRRSTYPAQPGWQLWTAKTIRAKTLPRTVLSTANAVESPTALMARSRNAIVAPLPIRQPSASA